VIAIYASENGQGMAFEAMLGMADAERRAEDSAPTLSLAPRPALRQPRKRAFQHAGRRWHAAQRAAAPPLRVLNSV
jgi:stringent starvation protein B